MDTIYQFFTSLYNNRDIVCILYLATPVPWQDGFSGENRLYFPTFTIIYNDYTIEHVEVIYPRKPLTQYLYAQNNLPNWRMINDDELRIIGIEPIEKIRWW